MNRLPILVIFFISYTSFAQSADFILLKKRHKTIATYYAGTSIAFTTTSGAYVDAHITQIKNDSLFLQEFIVQKVPTDLGFYILDTLGSYRYAYHYKQVKAIGITGRHFNFSASGASLLGGGLLLTLGSAVVYFADREKFSPQLMIAGVALGIVGYFMSRGSGKGMIIGKKYKLVYIDVN